MPIVVSDEFARCGAHTPKQIVEAPNRRMLALPLQAVSA
jgi:hypothetical protein